MNIDFNTVFILQSESTEGSTIFNDTGGSTGCPHPITTQGSVQHTTTRSKFGTSCIYFDGTSTGKLIIPDHEEFQFGTGDFTIDLWLYPLGNSNAGRVVHKAETGNQTPYMIYISAGILSFWTSADGGSWALQNVSMGTLSLNSWQHFAVVRQGFNFYTFKNGNLISSVTSSHSVWNGGKQLWIGNGYSTPQPYYGYIEELRISNVARWNSSFSPEIEPYAPFTTYSISGVVQEGNLPISRSVRAYNRNTGVLVGSTISAASDGTYTIILPTNDPCYVIAVDDNAGVMYNAIIYDWIIPQ